MTPAKELLIDRLYRALIAGRRAAVDMDVLHLTERANGTLGFIEQLRQQDPHEADPRLDLVIAAVELGVDAGRRRHWGLAHDALDLVHSLVIENHDPVFWEAAFWVPFAGRWPGHLGGGLGEAAEAMRISTFPATR